MDIFEILNFKKEERDELFDAIHECSHAFVIKLFPNLFEIKCITLYPEIYNKQIITNGWTAGINFSRKRNWLMKKLVKSEKFKSFITSNRRRIYISHRLVLILFASIVGQTIHTKGIDYLRNYNEDIMKLSGLNYKGCDRDLYILEQQMPNCLERVIEDYNKYYLSLLNSLFLYFTSNENVIWREIITFSKLLISKNNKTLMKKEINDFFSKDAVHASIKNARHEIINKSFNSYYK